MGTQGSVSDKTASRLSKASNVLGFPSLRGRGLFVSSTVVDSLANGMVFAFLLIYFQQVTDVPLSEIGLAMTIGRLLALATPPIAGIALDKWGSRRVVVVGNLISFIGVGLSAMTTGVWQIALSQLLIQVGLNFYWTSSRDLVSMAANGEELPRWFGLLGALRNVGIGAGSVVASAFLALQSDSLMRGLVAFSAFAFVAASILLMLWKRSTSADLPKTSGNSQSSAEGRQGRRGYSAVLRDKRYMVLLVINLVLVLVSMVLPLVVALWVVDVAGLGAGWAGALVLVNTVMVAVLSTLTVKLTERRRSTSVLVGALCFNALSFALMWSAGTFAENWAAALLLVLFMIIYSVAEMLSTPYMNDLSVSLADANNIGRYQGAFQSSWSLGMAIAPALFAGLLGVSSTLLVIFLISICVAVVPICILLGRSLVDGKQ
jgi:MFS family permease